MHLRDLTFLPLLVAPVIPLTLAEKANAEITLAQANASNTIQAVTQTEETLYFSPGTIYELPLVVDTSTVINGRQLLAGTVIQGRLEPVSGGLQYVATGIQAGELTMPLSASSDVLADVKDPRETSAGAIAGDAAIGAAGGAVIGAVLGNGVSILEVVGGAATGILVGNITAQRVVIVESGTPITLKAE
jgi:hypothetical protein